MGVLPAKSGPHREGLQVCVCGGSTRLHSDQELTVTPNGRYGLLALNSW